MSLRRLKHEFGPGMLKFWPFGVVASVGIITFLVGLKLSPQAASALSTGVLAATLVAVTWYTVETRNLRLQQRLDSEIRNHPWLKGSDLKVDWDKSQGGLLGRWIIYLPVTNVGTTPTYDLHVTVHWRVEGDKPSTGEHKIASLDLAPGDTGHIKLCEIDFDAPGEQANIDVEIGYKSFAGGGGRLKMNFYSHEKGWANGPMSPYQFWLSDGHVFPVKVAPVLNPAG